MEQTDINIDWEKIEKFRNDYKILLEKSVRWYEIAEQDGLEEDKAKEIAGENWEIHRKYISSLD
ncbi:hypothetical protein ACFOHU_03455 [Ottowia pentelensis]|uniref:Uncharacterized protein n=1 Tax=Ottowia pentelensis TaxID=511108 RepID=A0ABV6PVB8_9BURK